MSSQDVTRNNTLLLVELLKQHPCLWQVKNNLYKDRNYKKLSMAFIRAELSKIMDVPVSADILSKKIHTLRNQFRRELKLMKVI